jgi:tetratricopeptide (TPR) repeat protein
MLTADQRQSLAAAQARLTAGDAAGCLGAVDALAPPARTAPDARLLAALALVRLGRDPEARAELEAALAAAPDHAALWNSYGNLLARSGDPAAAVPALVRAASLAPDSPDPTINLGLVATRAGDHETAGTALARATRRWPRDPRGWAALGSLLRAERRGNPAAAFRRALELAPGDRVSRHNLALCLREADDSPAALAEIEAAMQGGLGAPETLTTRAHLLADLGRHEEAVAQYRAVIEAAPAFLDAQETLSRLLPQLGRADEALDGYRRGLARAPDSAPLWLSALGAAKALGDHRLLETWGRNGAARLGRYPEFVLAEASGRSLGGDPAGAIDLLRPLADVMPAHAPVHVHLAHNHLLLRDLQPAEVHALEAGRLDPADQSAWALLSLVWRLLGDAREQWLADHDRLVIPLDLPLAATDLAMLADRLHALHLTRTHPLDQSARGGTQTRGGLFDRADPAIRALAATIRETLEPRLAALPEDASHPFLGRRRARIAYQGSWSVRLAAQGYHQNHIHQQGWLSSALYIALPAEVASGEGGALAFGIPDPAFGLDLPPRRVVIPREAMLVVFPSYFWHGTLPFESENPRLTVAFDALPVN